MQRGAGDDFMNTTPTPEGPRDPQPQKPQLADATSTGSTRSSATREHRAGKPSRGGSHHTAAPRHGANLRSYRRMARYLLCLNQGKLTPRRMRECRERFYSLTRRQAFFRCLGWRARVEDAEDVAGSFMQTVVRQEAKQSGPFASRKVRSVSQGSYYMAGCIRRGTHRRLVAAARRRARCQSLEPSHGQTPAFAASAPLATVFEWVISEAKTSGMKRRVATAFDIAVSDKAQENLAKKPSRRTLQRGMQELRALVKRLNPQHPSL